MSWRDEMFAEMASFLRVSGLDAVKVHGVESVRKSGGSCDTCYYEYDTAVIYYVDSHGEEHAHDYYGSMTELMNVIT